MKRTIVGKIVMEVTMGLFGIGATTFSVLGLLDDLDSLKELKKIEKSMSEIKEAANAVTKS